MRFLLFILTFTFVYSPFPAFSYEIICSHWSVTASKNTEFAWFEMQLDNAKRDENHIIWKRWLDVESGEETQPKVIIDVIFQSEREVIASSTKLVSITDQQDNVVEVAPMFYNLRLDFTTGELFLFTSLNYYSDYVSIGTSLTRYSCKNSTIMPKDKD